jgi:hypothetical protein
MSKVLTAFAASIIVLGASSAFAYKLEPMSKQERTELRERADRLASEQRTDRRHDRKVSQDSDRPASKSSKPRRDDDTSSRR